ncbi:hypothetical protein [Comamonas aquatica]|uniref:hypothetical protein n=1 Tax=Comamonas aquatica TaxID=225991 RepID=UPI001EF265AD|nr:hypothetical protein [Comamonas aquatica]
MTESENTKPHPIQLHSTVFSKTVVIAISSHDPEKNQDSAEPVNKINIREIESEPGFYACSMRTVINESGNDAYPYQIDMECHAKLYADDTLSKEEARRGVLITAHSVLYGAIREQVAWLTSRQPFGTLMLGLSVLSAPPKNAD